MVKVKRCMNKTSKTQDFFLGFKALELCAWFEDKEERDVQKGLNYFLKKQLNKRDWDVRLNLHLHLATLDVL